MNQPNWRVSTRCSSGGCVAVATGPDRVLVRDSTDPESPTLNFSPAAWRGFIAAIRAGR